VVPSAVISLSAAGPDIANAGEVRVSVTVPDGAILGIVTTGFLSGRDGATVAVPAGGRGGVPGATRPPRWHAVYPGTFDPITPGHLDIIERARCLFGRITVLIAVNADKEPVSTQSERAIELRRKLPANWDNVSVTAWAGLTVAFCQQQDVDVIIRGVRGRSDLRHEYQLAAMNEALGITTLLLPARPELAATSSTILRGLGIHHRPDLRLP
jgi:pantetheine-phosphate adenylyltransferase